MPNFLQREKGLTPTNVLFKEKVKRLEQISVSDHLELPEKSVLQKQKQQREKQLQESENKNITITPRNRAFSWYGKNKMEYRYDYRYNRSNRIVTCRSMVIYRE